MATNTETLNLKLALDGLAQAQAGLLALSNTVSKVGQIFSAIGPSLAAVASGEIFGNMIKSSMEFAEKTELVSQKVGIAKRQFEALNYAAAISHVTMDDLQVSLKNFARHLEETGRGNENLMDALMQEAELFDRLPDGATKTALAIEHFGKSGMAMIPFLDKGPQAIHQLLLESERYGLVNGSAAMMSERFNQASIRLHFALLGLGTEIGVTIYPAVTKLVNGLAGATVSVRDFVATHPRVVQMGEALTAAGLSMAVLRGVGRVGGIVGSILGIGPAAVGGIKTLADLTAYIKMLPAIAGRATVALGRMLGPIMALIDAVRITLAYRGMWDAQSGQADAQIRQAKAVDSLMHKVMDTVKEMKANGKLSSDAADSLLQPIIDASKTGSLDKMASTLHDVVQTLQQMKGITPPKEESVWTKDELDRQEKMLSLQEREIRLQMERNKATDIPGDKSASASTGDSVPRLQTLMRQRRAMLEEAHKQGAVSDDEYAERSLKLNEDKFHLQQE